MTVGVSISKRSGSGRGWVLPFYYYKMGHPTLHLVGDVKSISVKNMWKYMGEKYVQAKSLGEESLVEIYIGEKNAQETFLGEESPGEKYVRVKKMCKKKLWVKSIWVKRKIEEEYLGEDFLAQNSRNLPGRGSTSQWFQHLPVHAGTSCT